MLLRFLTFNVLKPGNPQNGAQREWLRYARLRLEHAVDEGKVFAAVKSDRFALESTIPWLFWLNIVDPLVFTVAYWAFMLNMLLIGALAAGLGKASFRK